jgi:hypothetical protein
MNTSFEVYYFAVFSGLPWFNFFKYILFSSHRSQKKKSLHGLSPRANYTDRATAACRRSDLPIFADNFYPCSPSTAPPVSVKHKISDSYKIRGKIIIFVFVIITILDKRQEDKR